jgi:mRNA interferase MazF
MPKPSEKVAITIPSPLDRELERARRRWVMRRGEVWWAELPVPARRRPVLLLSRNEADAVRERVLVAPLSSRIRRIPTEAVLQRSDGVPRRRAIDLDTPTAIPKRLVAQRLTTLAPEKLVSAERALRFALGLL